MSTSDPSKSSLVARAAEMGARVTVLDARLQVVAQGFGQIDVELEPAIYKVRFETGAAVEQHVVDLEADARVECVSAQRHEFASAAPLAGTTKTHEYHMKLIEQASRNGPVARAGRGAAVLVSSRAWARDAQHRRRQTVSPATGMRLLAPDQSVLLDFDTHPGALRIAPGSGQDAAYAIHVEVDPGCYVIEVDLGDRTPCIRQTVVAVAGWQTQLFLLQRDVQIDVDHAPTSVADLASGGTSMSRMGRPFRPDDEEHRQVELMRRALFDGVEPSPDDVRVSCMHAFENPMLGILTGHVVARSRMLKPAVKHKALRNVVAHLEHLRVGDHPDVRALRLALGDLSAAGTFPDPPMLLASWTLIRNASAQLPELVPAASATGVAVRQLWGAGPWLLWVYDDDVASPLSTRKREAREEDEIMKRLARGTRVHRNARPASELRGGGMAHEPKRESIVEVARDMGLPYGDVERIFAKNRQRLA